MDEHNGKGPAGALCFVPGARIASGYWLAAVFAAFFYFYLFIVIVQSVTLSFLATSPVAVDRFRAVE